MRFAAAPALLAVLVTALLPGGFLPRIAGPCGQELCNCSIESVAENARHAKCPFSQPAESGLKLIECAVTSAEEPGAAMQFVFSGILAAEKTLVNPAHPESPQDAPTSRQFHLSLHARELSVPPPRA